MPTKIVTGLGTRTTTPRRPPPLPTATNQDKMGSSAWTREMSNDTTTNGRDNFLVPIWIRGITPVRTAFLHAFPVASSVMNASLISGISRERKSRESRFLCLMTWKHPWKWMKRCENPTRVCRWVGLNRTIRIPTAFWKKGPSSSLPKKESSCDVMNFSIKTSIID